MLDERAQLARLGARRARQVDAVGCDGLEQQPLRPQAGGHRRDAAQDLAGHPQRRLLGADLAAVERQHEQRAARARECGEQLQGARGRRSALHAAARGRREREALQIAAPSAAARGSPCLPCAPAARARAAAPTASRSAASSAALPRRAGRRRRAAAAGGRRARARARSRALRRLGVGGLAGLRREARGGHVQARPRGRARGRSPPAGGTRRVVMCSLSSPGQSGLPRQGDEGRCMLFEVPLGAVRGRSSVG